MVTDTDGYIHINEYLTAHLNLFEDSSSVDKNADSVISIIEIELSEQIIMVCSQNESLSFDQRNAIVQEVDAILYDLQEILSGVINNPVTNQQKIFIKEFSGLIKNLFDDVIKSFPK